MMLYKEKIHNLPLYEGLIHSVARGGVIQFLSHYANINAWERNDTNDIVIDDISPNIDLIKLTKAINNFGWFISTYDTVSKHKKYSSEFFKDNPIKIIIEAKYDVEIEDYNFPNFIYHATDEKYLAKIMKIGLTPKTKSQIAYHPDRIYFTQKRRMAMDIGNELKNITNLRILKIIPKKLLPNFRLFQDSKSKFYGGLYTLDNVPPSAITVLTKKEMM